MQAPIPANSCSASSATTSGGRRPTATSTSRTCSSWRSATLRARRCAGVVQARYRAFTVDEYQDVNLLQQTLLELWLGDRDDLCAVGDDYQAIYARVHRSDSAAPAQLPGHYPHTPSSCASRRTTARRPRCSRSPTGSCRSSVGRRRRCARRVRQARAGREGAQVAAGRARRDRRARADFTPRESRTRRWPCSTA